MSTCQTQGIILKKANWGERGQLFNIYTKDLGKIEVLARGTKKIQSKLNSHLQFFTVIDLGVVNGKNIDQLTGAIIFKSFSQLKGDFRKIILASFGLELIDNLTKPDHCDEKIFDLLLRFLEVIDKKQIIKKTDWLEIERGFIIQLMTFLGYKPTPEIISSQEKIRNFLKSHLDQELKTQKIISYLSLD